MKLKIAFPILLFSVITLLSSCYSPAKIVGTNESILGKNIAPKIIPPEGKALIYIVRRPAFYAAAFQFGVDMDRKLIGHTQANRFLYIYADPGIRRFVGHGENKSNLELEVEAGKTYYIEQKTRIGGFFPRNKLVLLDEKEGRRKLSYCKLSRDNITREGI